MNLRELPLPTVKARRNEMQKKIKELIDNGYTQFKINVERCLNKIESPDPDKHPEGFEFFGFWHDCHKRNERDGEYNDYLLYAAKH